MREEKARKIRWIYGICLSVYTFIVGALFIVQTWRIFLPGGKGNYTAASIAEKFSEIALPVWLWVAAVVIGGALAIAFPISKTKPKAYVTTQIQLERLGARLLGGEDSDGKAKKERKFRIALGIACAIACAVAACVALFIMLDKSYVAKVDREFFSGTNAVVDRLFSLVPWGLAAFALAIAAAYLIEGSRRREVQILKAELAKEGKIAKAPAKPKTEQVENRRLVLIVRIVLAAVALMLVVVGIVNGGMSEVFKKAINICTQCIGLG
ncbi:MAG: hypothetical protein IKD47_03930 [Clostridia bacterium]|nr:hypothetical protein [Clostridia bacterium]